MYQPEHFRIAETNALHEVMRAHPLAQLVTAGPGGLMANPVPFITHGDEGEHGVLRAHLARPNLQWREIEAGAEVLVIFQGHEGYVTPSWYASKREHGKVVPTWNYVIVQVRGRAIVRPDAEWLRTQVGAMTDTHEAGRSHPWAVGDAPESYIDMQLRAIVGLEIEIRDIRGKWKVSQNRPIPDREGVAAGLGSSAQEDERLMAGLVRERQTQG